MRMGVHTGEPIATDEGYLGIDVHRAARIAASGHGGQVLVSQSTRDLVGAEGLRDLGEHRLKDRSAPERIYQLGDGTFPPLKTLYATNLPVPTSPFLGRAQELGAVEEQIRDTATRLLTLAGPGGTGKTRLALQAAAEAADEYQQGVWWVPLAAITDAASVLPTAAQVLGGGAPLAEIVGDRRLLLLLDNFEHVIDAAAELPALLAACRNLDVLVTSRELLHVRGEHVYPVPVLARAAACQLFVARAREVDPGFEPDAFVDEICARLDDLPLALELAAARTSLLTSEQLLERLGSRLDLLRGGRDAELRQADVAGDDRVVIRPVVGRGAARACRVVGLSRQLVGRDRRAGVSRRPRGARVARRQEPRPPLGDPSPRHARDDPRVRRGAACAHRPRRASPRAARASPGAGGGRQSVPEAVGSHRPELIVPERANIDIALAWALGAGEVGLGLRLMWLVELHLVTGDPLAAEPGSTRSSRRPTTESMSPCAPGPSAFAGGHST